MRYYRENPDEPINHDWYSRGQRVAPREEKVEKIDRQKFLEELKFSWREENEEE